VPYKPDPRFVCPSRLSRVLPTRECCVLRQQRHKVLAMRRFGVIVALALSAQPLIAAPASATCLSMPFDQAIHQADAVWWGTVSGADLRLPGDNNWTLTVRISRVLKGHEQVGDTGKYFDSFCGYPLTPEEAKKYASRLIGQQMLFVGTYASGGSGGLGRLSDLFTPGLSPAEQYQRALRVLGLLTPVSPLAPFVSGGVPLWLRIAVVALAVVAVAVLSLFIFARRRSQTPDNLA
jgi:hypothetical protein